MGRAATVLVLAAQQVADRARFDAAVDPVDEMPEQQGLRGERPVGFELADPVTVGCLASEEVLLRARDCLVESRHDRKW